MYVTDHCWTRNGKPNEKYCHENSMFVFPDRRGVCGVARMRATRACEQLGRHDGAYPSVRERCGGAEKILDGDDGRQGRPKRAAHVDPIPRGLRHAAAS